MGGMPSTHSSLVSSLSTIIYLNYGINNPLTSIVIIFSLLIIYDSMGIRYESSKHAYILNKITNYNLNDRLGHKTYRNITRSLSRYYPYYNIQYNNIKYLSLLPAYI